ncbi:hypothetical protein HanPI659440_Chr11g0408561 [Helianthus annuus]|nr:hypothetical protein HanPI659440_Chr11g0408561 [Helianthus annuus]
MLIRERKRWMLYLKSDPSLKQNLNLNRLISHGLFSLVKLMMCLMRHKKNEERIDCGNREENVDQKMSIHEQADFVTMLLSLSVHFTREGNSNTGLNHESLRTTFDVLRSESLSF